MAVACLMLVEDMEVRAMIKILAVMLSASLAACAGQAEVRFSGGSTEPDLIALDTDPRVMVVANADEPIFYTDHAYWLYRDHHWYRSNTPRTGWARIEVPPVQVRRIDRPTTYVHFRRDTTAPRTTYNEPRPTGALPRSIQRDRPERRAQPLPGPAREPNPQGPPHPYPDPLPPHQVPPAGTGQHDGPDHQLPPDPDRAPTTPGMQDRGGDQRPEANRDDRRDFR
jgi:hypothetical protein